MLNRILAFALLFVPTNALAQSVITQGSAPIGSTCDLGFTTPDAIDCAGYYSGNLINGSALDIANQQDAIAALDGDFVWNGAWADVEAYKGYAEAQKQDWTNARQQLDAGSGALEQHPPAWRARFELALAQSAFELNDYAAAQAAQPCQR